MSQVLFNLKEIKEDNLRTLEGWVKKMFTLCPSFSDCVKLRLETTRAPFFTDTSERAQLNNLKMIKDYFVDRGYSVEVVGDISELIFEAGGTYLYELIFRKNKED